MGAILAVAEVVARSEILINYEGAT